MTAATDKPRYAFDAVHAVRTLKRRDPSLAALMRRVGPYALQLRDSNTPFQALLHAIVYQQLSGRAAGSIHRRLLALFPHRYASAARLLALSDSELLAAGLSRAKVKAVRDLALKCRDGSLPTTRRLKRMHDDAVIEALLQVRGIGVWSAQMLLIFHQGRPDILPAGDLGIRKGFRIAYGLNRDPQPEDVLRHGECWRPYRSVAAWYLWRANYL